MNDFVELGIWKRYHFRNTEKRISLFSVIYTTPENGITQISSCSLFDTPSRTSGLKGRSNSSQENIRSLYIVQLKSIVEKHLYRGSCSFKEAKFLLSFMDGYKIPNFILFGKS